MRYILGFLSGVLGGLAGWAGLAALVLAFAGPQGGGDEGDMAMGAVFEIGPLGGVAGFLAGFWLFLKFGVSRAQGEPKTRRISRPVAGAVVMVCAGLAWGGWWTFIRSPYLSHGADALMSLRLQFRLPPGMAPPADPQDVAVVADDGSRLEEAQLGPNWRAEIEGRATILAAIELSHKTYGRTVRLTLKGKPELSWSLGLASDPYPVPQFTPWRRADHGAGPAVEMRFRLTADRCASCDD